ncbi:COX15/CtaA family protein [Timonella sp. A28]|uniref:COX15/CtaA family protein n=1 Tax=Timonella sp. A28 TaxID=3442640 RepID=UPI003EBAA3B4
MNTPVEAPASQPVTRQSFLRKLGGRLQPHANAFAIANIVAQVGIIVTGGLVRLTGSGLGCSTWPLCEPGQFTPEFHSAASYHPFVEFGNRTLTGVLTLIAVLLVLSVVFDQSRTRTIRRMVWLPLIGIAVQAVLGGITVLVDLHPTVVASHMAISVMLVAVSTLVQYRLSPRPRDGVTGISPWVTQWAWILVSLLIPVIVMGVIVTGSGPHSGDTEVGYRLDFDPMAITKIHALFVWIFVAALIVVAVGLLVMNRKTPHAVSRAQLNGVWWLFAVTIIQAFIGYYQTFNGLPIAAVALHMFGAGIMTVATIRLILLITTPVVSDRPSTVDA